MHLSRLITMAMQLVTLSQKLLITRDPCCFQDLFDEHHIYIFALMWIRKNDHDVSFNHVWMLATLVRSLKTEVLKLLK